jgi:hypothetical protein
MSLIPPLGDVIPDLEMVKLIADLEHLFPVKWSCGIRQGTLTEY